MNVIRHSTAGSFLDAAQTWLMEAEVENNVILGIALSMARQTLTPAEPPYFATAVENGEVVACAVRNPPHKLVMSRASPHAALAVAHDAFTLYPTLPAVLGPEPAARAFASAWSDLAGSGIRIGMRQRLFVIDSVEQQEPPVPGKLRLAEASDLERLTPWVAEFTREATPTEDADPAEIARRFHRDGRLFVWDDDGPVSMVSFGGKTPNGARVHLVYTPRAMRRRGYATAVVTALTRHLLSQGNRYCCLYTDLANPTSNSIYQQIGYRPLCDMSDYLLAG